MRLIDADAVLERIEWSCDARCLYKDYKEPLRSKMCNCCDLGDARMYVEDAPTIDAEPIRHGHWKEHSWDWEKKVCSVCGGEVESIPYLLKDGRARTKGTPYCSWCGAIMDDDTKFPPYRSDGKYKEYWNNRGVGLCSKGIRKDD